MCRGIGADCGIMWAATIKLEDILQFKTSYYATNEEVLTILAASHELPAHVLNYR